MGTSDTDRGVILSNRYRLERELGRGGMATVHLAHDLRHDRKVAIKIIHAAISAPFEQEALAPFARWYRAAAARGCRLRCVFEDTGMYRGLVRDLQLRNFDEAILGERYEEQSVIADTGMSHFDLIRSSTVHRHLDALLARIAAGTQVDC